jgi:hypothetical protein
MSENRKLEKSNTAGKSSHGFPRINTDKANLFPVQVAHKPRMNPRESVQIHGCLAFASARNFF